MSGYYNFLPPIDQVNEYTINFNYPGNINRLDPYLPEYNITTGDVIPLILGPTGIPQNIYGTTGPTGPTGYSGYSGNPPPATPVAMFAYGQTNQGIVQFVLMYGSTLPQISQDTVVYQSNNYYFTPVSDVLDLSRVVPIYCVQNDLTTKGQNGAPSSSTSYAYRFFDAKSVKSNPTSSVSNYELKYHTYGEYTGNSDSAANWPNISNGAYGNQQGSLVFWFNELVNNTVNPNEKNLKLGKLYHPRFISLYNDVNQNNDDYAQYQLNMGFIASPGYPVNINYSYVPINSQTLPVLNNGIDTATVTYNPINSDGGPASTISTYAWNGQVPLVVYNSTVDKISSLNDLNLNGDVFNNPLMPNLFENGGFLPCNCNNNNECSGLKASDAVNYFAENCNTIQAGVANYLTYQFLPFSQIKTPPGFVITNPQNTTYSYITLPDGYSPNVSIANLPGSTGPSGANYYFSQVESLIDGNTGATGLTKANTSIMSSWMTNPTNTQFSCTRQETSAGFCGFNDYYDSLFGIDYDYGVCGTPGINLQTDSLYQKGACPGGQVCVPNFQYLSGSTGAYDPLIYSPFICVPGPTGASTVITPNNFSYYVPAIPSSKNAPKTVYTPYTPSKETPPVDTSTEKTPTDKIWLYIGIALGIILLIVIIFFFISSNKKEPGILGNQIDIIPPPNKYGINIVY